MEVLARPIVVALASACLGAACVSAEERMDPQMQVVVDSTLQDASTQSGLDVAALKVESAEAVTWSDGSLGCPAPGMMYTQALVPGYRIRIRAGEAMLDYHASTRGNFVLCSPDRSVEPTPGVAR